MMPIDAAVRFAALGDARRLELITRIAALGEVSISDIAHGQNVTRQAVTRHLRVLEGAGLLRSRAAGRECLWSLDEQGIANVEEVLQRLSGQWRQRLARLKLLVEAEGDQSH